MQPVVQTSSLKAYYVLRSPYGEKEYIHAVEDVDLSVDKMEILGIAGESGCGKSTLLKVLYGLITPPLEIFDGKIVYTVDGASLDLLSLDQKKLRTMRGKTFSYVPQGSMSVLNPTMRIRNQFFEVILAHQRDMEREEAEGLIEKHVDELGLPIEVLTSFPHQLSGGMRQRVVIALSALLKPKVIFADEPTTALDVMVQRGVIQLLLKVQKNLQNSLVLVTHDMGVQAEITDRIAIMYAGKIVEIAPTEELFEIPYHPYTRFLIGSLPEIGDKAKRVSISGLPPSLRNPPKGCRFNPRCPNTKAPCNSDEPSMVQISSEHYVACHECTVR